MGKAICCAVFTALLMSVTASLGKDYLVCVSNEKSGDITIFDGSNAGSASNIPVGKRPRGIHASPDGKYVYVALSGSPIAGPRVGRTEEDEEQNRKADHSADGIGVIDVQQRKFIRRLNGGSDPEQFAVSPDGKRLYIANEDTASATVVNIESGNVEHTFPLRSEPEGVALTPDGKRLFVTCETGGEVFVIDTQANRITAQFNAGPRARNVVFLPDLSQAYIPSESKGVVHVIDPATLKTLRVIQLPPNSRPMGLALGSGGQRLYVTTGWGASVCVIDTQTHDVLNTIKAGARPWGIAISPDGKRLFVANGPSDDVSILDVEAQKEIRRVKAGKGPWGVAVVSGSE